MIRVGQGFDLHRLEAGRPFALGGVNIEHDKGPVGHSDGDVLLHAITDALLGATGLGDIGEWFPPEDPHLAGANSATLLQNVVNRLKEDGWHIENADTTILLEAPKLSPHKAAMGQRLAELLGIEPEAVSVKAKTMEGLGPIGQGDAVAAMAVVLLTQP